MNGERVQDIETRLAALIPELPRLAPEVKALYLFGSCATGRSGPASDADLGVYADPSALEGDPLLDLKLGAFFERQLRMPVDLVVMNRADPILQHEILRTGRRLFEADHAFRARAELAAFKQFLDARYYQEKRDRYRRTGRW